MMNKIKLARTEVGFTQEQLAEKSGISRPALSDIETGKVIPNGLNMIRIANALGKPVEQVFFESDVLQEEQNVI